MALTRLLAPHMEMELPGGVVNKAQDQHGAQGEQQLVCGLHFHSHYLKVVNGNRDLSTGTCTIPKVKFRWWRPER